MILYFRSRKNFKGFTLIELLVVISIIGLLSSLAVISLDNARRKARVARAASDLKQIAMAVNLYFNDNGVYPCFDHTWDDAKETAWTATYIKWPKNPWGYHYHWEHTLQGFTYSISVQSPGQENAEALANLMDDGNLTTGIIRGNSNRLEYGGIDQTIPLIDCHI